MGRGRPYYQQMRDDIKKKIQCGDYKRGQYLPCEKKLEEEYGVSRTTVRSAIRMAISILSGAKEQRSHIQD